MSHIQRILLFKMNRLSLDDKLIPAYACAWERLQNRLDRMQGNPEPKPVDVTRDVNVSRRQRQLADAIPVVAVVHEGDLTSKGEQTAPRQGETLD